MPRYSAYRVRVNRPGYKPFGTRFRKSYGRYGYRKSQDSQTKRVTYKYIYSQSVNSTGYASQLTLNPAYTFVTSDARYVNFVKTCNEWRIDKVTWTVMPLQSSNGEIGPNNALSICYCADRSAPYRADTISGAITVPTVLAVPDAKVLSFQQGAKNIIYHTLKSGFGQQDFIQAGGAVPTAPNGGAIFTPELVIAYNTNGITATMQWSVYVQMDIVTRGQRFMATL